MAKAKASELDARLCARKEEGAPSVRPGPEEAREEPGMTSHSPSDTIAVTVRLDEARYVKLKVLGARTRRTNQEMLIVALDAYLQKAGARANA